MYRWNQFMKFSFLCRHIAKANCLKVNQVVHPGLGWLRGKFVHMGLRVLKVGRDRKNYCRQLILTYGDCAYKWTGDVGLTDLILSLETENAHSRWYPYCFQCKCRGSNYGKRTVRRQLGIGKGDTLARRAGLLMRWITIFTLESRIWGLVGEDAPHL